LMEKKKRNKKVKREEGKEPERDGEEESG